MEGRTYRYPTSEPLFPFGFGLSYSQFVYRRVDVRPKILRFTDPVLVDVYVENKGPYDGDEVCALLQCFVTMFVYNICLEYLFTILFLQDLLTRFVSKTCLQDVLNIYLQSFFTGIVYNIALKQHHR